MALCLTPEEIEDLTQKKRYSAQVKVLRALGIEPGRRPDGSIVVDRAYYEECVRGAGAARPEVRRKTQPIWN